MRSEGHVAKLINLQLMIMFFSKVTVFGWWMDLEWPHERARFRSAQDRHVRPICTRHLFVWGRWHAHKTTRAYWTQNCKINNFYNLIRPKCKYFFVKSACKSSKDLNKYQINMASFAYRYEIGLRLKLLI